MNIAVPNLNVYFCHRPLLDNSIRYDSRGPTHSDSLPSRYERRPLSGMRSKPSLSVPRERQLNERSVFTPGVNNLGDRHSPTHRHLRVLTTDSTDFLNTARPCRLETLHT